MGNRDDLIELEGEVTESLPNAIFKVKLKDDYIVTAHLSGKMRMHFIKIVPGDKIIIEMSQYDLTRGRIIYRYK